MVLAEFHAGSGPVAQTPQGPTAWPYLSSGRRVQGSWEPFPEPSVPVVLHGPLNWCKTVALLDTGADTTAIPYGWAGPLGCDLEKAMPLIAEGNGVEAEYLRPVEPLRLEIGGCLIDLKAIFGPWQTMFLGRDVFDHFRVTFDQRAQTVILDPYGP